MFSLLWLAFMKLLLSYYDVAQANVDALQQTIQDNLARVIAFLEQRGVLVAPSDAPSTDRVALYVQSKQVIAPFWS